MSNLSPAVLRALQFAKPLKQSGKFIDPGSHVLAVRSFTLKPPTKTDENIEVTFEVLESDTLAAGSRVIEIFNLLKAEKFKDSDSDSDRAVAFVGALVGCATLPEATASMAYALENAQTQPLRGIAVRCKAARNKKNTYTHRNFSHIAQDGAQIATMRAHLDATEEAAAPAPIAPPQAVAYTPPAPPAFMAAGIAPPPAAPLAFVAPGAPAPVAPPAFAPWAKS